PLTFSGNVTLIGANTLNLANTTSTTFSGVVAGTGALTVTAAAGVVPGPLVLSNPNNTFSSGFVLGAVNALPVVQVAGSGSLGSSNLAPLTLTTIILNGGELLANTADLNFQ